MFVQVKGKNCKWTTKKTFGAGAHSSVWAEKRQCLNVLLIKSPALLWKPCAHSFTHCVLCLILKQIKYECRNTQTIFMTRAECLTTVSMFITTFILWYKHGDYQILIEEIKICIGSFLLFIPIQKKPTTVWYPFFLKLKLKIQIKIYQRVNIKRNLYMSSF